MTVNPNIAMTISQRLFIASLTTFLTLAGSGVARAAADPLPSWADGPTRAAILDFVARVTEVGGADYVAPAERIATFDNDGTLWVEQPFYTQLVFVIDRARTMAEIDPTLLNRPAFKAATENDVRALVALGETGIAELAAATHAGMPTEAFDVIVEEWFATARHSRFDRPFDALVYQPMLELLAFLRDNEFKIFIVSGGGVEFMRAFAERTYGIPPEQVIGSSGKTRFELRDDIAILDKLADINAVDDGPGKPVNIHLHIGRRPIFAAGNSDGDLQMLQWTTLARGPRFALIVHHTDEAREYAYDRESSIGKLDLALDEAERRGWTVIDMKRDWRAIFPPQE